MGGLQRMPFNQGQFGDSMLTGFTRGVQQFDAEELAKAKEQAAIDLEQFRYDAQQAASADSIAENRRRYKEGRADKQNTFHISEITLGCLIDCLACWYKSLR